MAWCDDNKLLTPDPSIPSMSPDIEYDGEQEDDDQGNELA